MTAVDTVTADAATTSETTTDSVTTEQPAESHGTTATTESAPRTLDVNGQALPESEVVNGYLRQSDYTRKTQELAAQRQQIEAAANLWQHLQEDPASTMQALQDHYAELLSEEPIDPEEERLRGVEGYIAEQQQRELQNELNAELSRIAQVHGEYDQDALLEFAIENNIGSLEAALVYQRELHNAAHVQGDAERLAAKQGAPPISTGGSRAAGAVGDSPPTELGSFEDSLAASMKELGVDSILDLIGEV